VVEVGGDHPGGAELVDLAGRGQLTFEGTVEGARHDLDGDPLAGGCHTQVDDSLAALAEPADDPVDT
jgi:hypothetical protein